MFVVSVNLSKCFILCSAVQSSAGGAATEQTATRQLKQLQSRGEVRGSEGLDVRSNAGGTTPHQHTVCSGFRPLSIYYSTVTTSLHHHHHRYYNTRHNIHVSTHLSLTLFFAISLSGLRMGAIRGRASIIPISCEDSRSVITLRKAIKLFP